MAGGLQHDTLSPESFHAAATIEGYVPPYLAKRSGTSVADSN